MASADARRGGGALGRHGGTLRHPQNRVLRPMEVAVGHEHLLPRKIDGVRGHGEAVRVDLTAAPVHSKVKRDDDEVVVQDLHGVLAYPEALQNTSNTQWQSLKEKVGRAELKESTKDLKF